MNIIVLYSNIKCKCKKSRITLYMYLKNLQGSSECKKISMKSSSPVGAVSTNPFCTWCCFLTFSYDTHHAYPHVYTPHISTCTHTTHIHMSTCTHTTHVFDRYRMVTRAKSVSWPGVRWSAVDDSRLLVGVLEHGIGNWDSIRDDSVLNLGGKVGRDLLINFLDVTRTMRLPDKKNSNQQYNSDSSDCIIP